MSDNNNNITNSINELENDLTSAQAEVRTLRELVAESQRETLSGASTFEITLPGGIKIVAMSNSDPRLDQVAPAGTTVQPKTSAQAGA